MYNHAPADYACPFCRLAQQTEHEDVSCTVYHDSTITAFVSSHWWPNNPGHVLIVPNQHYENIYDLPIHLAARIRECAKAVALAMKAAYSCDGVSTRQHNEPAGNQDVWHYHLHAFPRYQGDELYTSRKQSTTAEERADYAQRLRTELGDWTPGEWQMGS